MSLHLNNNGDYIDVDIYVDRPDIDWLFQVTLDVEANTIYDGDPRSGTHPHGMFDEAENDPPADVLAEFQAQRPKAVAMLSQHMKPNGSES